MPTALLLWRLRKPSPTPCPPRPAGKPPGPGNPGRGRGERPRVCDARALGTADRWPVLGPRPRETAMGVMRKTLSVGTLGVVSFRSKKERLRRAERSQRDAEAFLEAEHAARVAAEA